jgi:hypothetical protein
MTSRRMFSGKKLSMDWRCEMGRAGGGEGGMAIDLGSIQIQNILIELGEKRRGGYEVPVSIN